MGFLQFFLYPRLHTFCQDLRRNITTWGASRQETRSLASFTNLGRPMDKRLEWPQPNAEIILLNKSYLFIFMTPVTCIFNNRPVCMCHQEPCKRVSLIFAHSWSIKTLHLYNPLFLSLATSTSPNWLIIKPCEARTRWVPGTWPDPIIFLPTWPNFLWKKTMGLRVELVKKILFQIILAFNTICCW